MAQTTEIDVKVDVSPAKTLIAAAREGIRNLLLTGVFTEVLTEITKARAKHGPNDDLRLGFGSSESILTEADRFGEDLYICCDVPDNAALERAFKAMNDNLCADNRKHTRLGILAEEFFEAAAADDVHALRAELVQVAAMAMDTIVDIDAKLGEDA